MDKKSDKQLVWDAIKEIEQRTAYTSQFFTILNENAWQKWDKSDRLRIRALLLSNGLVQIVANNQWAFQLTPMAMVLQESDLNEDGTLKTKTDKQYWKGVKTALIGALIGAVLSTGLSALLEVWKVKYLSPPQASTIVLPKIQIVHDTIWSNKISPKKP